MAATSSKDAFQTEYIESLRLFRTILEVKNFRRAGEIMGLSPSVVSRLRAIAP